MYEHEGMQAIEVEGGWIVRFTGDLEHQAAYYPYIEGLGFPQPTAEDAVLEVLDLDFEGYEWERERLEGLLTLIKEVES